MLAYLAVKLTATVSGASSFRNVWSRAWRRIFFWLLLRGISIHHCRVKVRFVRDIIPGTRIPNWICVWFVVWDVPPKICGRCIHLCKHYLCRLLLERICIHHSRVEVRFLGEIIPRKRKPNWICVWLVEKAVVPIICDRCIEIWLAMSACFCYLIVRNITPTFRYVLR